ncbi:FAD-dependent oxidoreductase [Legionella impletisoli]|uniref:Kynurenine 3-monooxygenase n=1 Tax=Legionella impletisoli TaxID=343510 RepID=A0A917N9P9_9GAMM|nr:NAD(P)/FAD-dependent oxidoreductase [Legionella impletisoli]GGI81208.1 kynurenine 3-monooxygenase [Legionella impletisoli]
MKQVTIVGSGLAGTLLALYLARRGYKVSLYEARGDVRKEPMDGGRSINLALSCRGITSLKAIGLMDQVTNIIVPMRARAIHEEQGEVSFQAFGRHKDEYINAILRSELNALLLNEAEKSPLIELNFNLKLLDIHFEEKKLRFVNANNEPVMVDYQRLVGADGAGSFVREAMKQHHHLDYTREFLPHGYKELSISSNHGGSMVREHLHLWPRDSFMLLGNPNLDDSITGSLFMPNRGKNSFESLDSKEKLMTFFKTHFSDVVDAMPNLVGEFFAHPTGNMSTIKCTKWYYQDHCLLIGDAAHGIIPFFGQGMNCAFEDCRIFDGLLEQYEDQWDQALPAFFEERVKNTLAVAAMSMDNYREIQHDIRDKQFNLKKQIEKELMRRYPDRYVSKHVLVMFTNTPYLEAYAHGQIQTEFIDKICKNTNSFNEIDWARVDALMPLYDKKMAELDVSAFAV